MTDFENTTFEALGFSGGAKEFHRLVAAVDLTAPGAMAAFESWKLDDGSKAGLLRLPGVAAADSAAIGQADGDAGVTRRRRPSKAARVLRRALRRARDVRERAPDALIPARRRRAA